MGPEFRSGVPEAQKRNPTCSSIIMATGSAATFFSNLLPTFTESIEATIGELLMEKLNRWFSIAARVGP
jgi:hypothetical protein